MVKLIQLCQRKGWQRLAKGPIFHGVDVSTESVCYGEATRSKENLTRSGVNEVCSICYKFNMLLLVKVFITKLDNLDHLIL